MGCRAVLPIDVLIRCSATAEGDLEVGRRLPGRGAWLCADSPLCVVNALRRKAFAKTLRRPLTEASLASFAARFPS